MATRRVTRVGQTILVRRAIREQRRTRTLWRAVLVAAVVVATALESWSARPAAADAVSPTVSRVILTDASGAAGPLVRSLGGVVHADLPLINAVVADLPAQAVDQLRSKVGVVVTPDAPVAVAEYSALPSDVTSRGPAAVFPESTGATALHAEGTTGRGVDVAVLDTGIDPLPDFGNRLIDGVDLSGEGDPFLDSYGHGTFVAGVIAGSGASSGGAYQGEAPGAGLVSVKVAGASGVTDLATVIAGISWVVNNRTADNIGVLNISMGNPALDVDGAQPARSRRGGRVVQRGDGCGIGWQLRTIQRDRHVPR